jgi:hypothetical protein
VRFRRAAWRRQDAYATLPFCGRALGRAPARTAAAGRGHIRCSASDRIRVQARPVQHVHRGVPDRRRRTRQSASSMPGQKRKPSWVMAARDQLPACGGSFGGSRCSVSRKSFSRSRATFSAEVWITLGNSGNRCFQDCRKRNSAANFGPPNIRPNLCFLCYLLFKFSSVPSVVGALRGWGPLS